MNRYDELKEKQQKEFNNFPVAFAFSDEAFNEGMKKLGLDENDIEKVASIGFRGFIKKSDKDEYINMHKRFKQEINDEINNPTTGEQFAKDMFDSELSNHEYGYTKDLEDTLKAVGYSIDEINNNDNLRNGLRLALDRYNREDNQEEEEENEQ